jgi:tripartite-type tricarboxylate transporter receptor subunit TctC
MAQTIARQCGQQSWEIRMRLIRIVLVMLTAALGIVLPSDASRSQAAFPAKAVRIVIPYPAGGGTDVLGRVVADQLSRKWGQTVIVENVGGAAGNIGAADVFRAAPDGYTLMVTSPGPVATNKFLYKEMPFDPARWTSIALLATGPYVLTMRKSFEGSTVKDLIAYAKANPGKITSATPGIGSVGHLATVELEMLADIKTVMVPYRGLSLAVNDIIAGHVDLMFDTPTTSLPLHREGKVKIIGTGTPERVPEFPEIPTIAESGVPGYRAVTWYAMVAPPQMPAALADRINHDVVEILGRPDVVEKVRGIQMDPATKSRAEAASFFAEETELWGKVIKQANIPPQ